MLSVTNKPLLLCVTVLNVVMLDVIMLNGAVPHCNLLLPQWL